MSGMVKEQASIEWRDFSTIPPTCHSVWGIKGTTSIDTEFMAFYLLAHGNSHEINTWKGPIQTQRGYMGPW